MKIYVCASDFSLEALMLLRKVHDVVLNPREGRISIEKLTSVLNKYDVIIIDVREKLTADIYELIKGNRKIIVSLSRGLDHIASCFFADKKIKIINCDEANVQTVAEHTLALLLALSKHIVPNHYLIDENFGRLKGRSFELSGKVLGCIGAGKIGTKVMEMSKWLGMEVLCYTAHPRKHKNLAVKFVSLEKLLAESDVITVLASLNEKSYHLLNCDNLSLVKDGAILINTARADIVEKKALINFVKNGKLGGVGLDIDFDDTNFVNEMRGFDNVILTPHVAGSSNESVLRMDLEASLKLLKYVRR